MWVFNGTLPEIALRATIIYAVVLLGIRLAGKREVGQMTSFALPGGPQERDALSREPPPS